MTAIKLRYLLRLSLRASFLNEILEISAFGKNDTYITERIDRISETYFATFLNVSKSLADTKLSLQQTRSLYCSDTECYFTEAKDICSKKLIFNLINVNNYHTSCSEFAF